jgi:hypothetical protein
MLKVGPARPTRGRTGKAAEVDACAPHQPVQVRLVVEHVGVGAAEEMRHEDEEEDRAAAHGERITEQGVRNVCVLGFELGSSAKEGCAQDGRERRAADGTVVRGCQGSLSSCLIRHKRGAKLGQEHRAVRNRRDTLKGRDATGKGVTEREGLAGRREGGARQRGAVRTGRERRSEQGTPHTRGQAERKMREREARCQCARANGNAPHARPLSTGR